MSDIKSFSSFESAARAILKFLHQRLGFDLWMVTRTEGNDWIVLQAEDNGYGVEEGAVFNWADSFCSQMTQRLGPRVAPRSAEVAAYASAPIGRQVAIGAYVGVPLRREDGALFGTLCAIDPAPQPEALTEELPLIELLGRLLCSVLESELKAADETRRAERAEAESLSDSLTGLYNRRGWNQLLAAEEGRCRRYGHPACVLSMDLDGLKIVNDTAGHGVGDELICRAAQALRSAVRTQDVVARIGGDEFVVLGVECDLTGGKVLLKRVSEALNAAGVQASLGIASRDPRHDLQHAIEQADQAMYRSKRTRRTTATGQILSDIPTGFDLRNESACHLSGP